MNDRVQLPIFEYDESYIQQIEIRCRKGIKKLIINPDSGQILPLRNWRVDRFVAVIDDLSSRLEINIVLVGKEESENIAKHIISHVEKRNTY